MTDGDFQAAWKFLVNQPWAMGHESEREQYYRAVVNLPALMRRGHGLSPAGCCAISASVSFSIIVTTRLCSVREW